MGSFGGAAGFLNRKWDELASFGNAVWWGGGFVLRFSLDGALGTGWHTLASCGGGSGLFGFQRMTFPTIGGHKVS